MDGLVSQAYWHIKKFSIFCKSSKWMSKTHSLCNDWQIGAIVENNYQEQSFRWTEKEFENLRLP